MKLGLFLGGQNTPMKSIVELGQGAETAGFDSVWVPEFWRSGYVPLTAIACATTRVRLSQAVVMAFPRSPFLQARSAVDLDELSEGRYMLGIGTGNRRNDLGWPASGFPKPIAGMREYVEVVRRFWDAWYYHPGDPIEHRGQYYTVNIPGYYGAVEPPRPDIPVYMAAVLPRMTQLSGEIGDGFVGHPHASLRYFRDEVKPNHSSGAKRAGKDPLQSR